MGVTSPGVASPAVFPVALHPVYRASRRRGHRRRRLVLADSAGPAGLAHQDRGRASRSIMWKLAALGSEGVGPADRAILAPLWARKRPERDTPRSGLKRRARG